MPDHPLSVLPTLLSTPFRRMKFCVQLSPYLPGASYGSKRLLDDMMEHAVL